MKLDDDAYRDVLQTAARALATPRFLQIVHEQLFQQFRAEGVALLLDVCGPDHPLYRDFSLHVNHATRDAVETGVTIIRSLRSITEHQPVGQRLGFDDLLHPVIVDASRSLYETGHYRDAVFSSVVAVFDLLRKRSGLDLDGPALVTRCFSVSEPKIVVADITTISGKNEQIGFMQILEGTYKAVRNPKAHTLQHDTTREVAAQYMVFASLLARRVAEAEVVN